jgi:hypothetical protein
MCEFGYICLHIYEEFCTCICLCISEMNYKMMRREVLFYNHKHALCREVM